MLDISAALSVRVTILSIGIYYIFFDIDDFRANTYRHFVGGLLEIALRHFRFLKKNYKACNYSDIIYYMSL